MMVLNDTPHSIHTRKPEPVVSHRKRPKPVPMEVRAAPALGRLKGGATILYTRTGRGSWSWTDTGGSVGKRIASWLRKEGHMKPLDAALFDDQPAQTWGAA
jgi:hypothetical protein